MKKGLLYLMVSRIVWIASGFAIHVGLGRLLGPEQYGIFGVIISLISVTYLVLGNGIRQAVTKYIASDLRLAGVIKTTGLKIQTILCLMFGGAFFLLSRPIAILLGDDTLASFIKLSAFIIPPIGILFVYMGSLEGVKQFGKWATISMMYAILKVFFVFLLVLLGLKVYGAIIGLILAVFFTAMVGGFFCRGLQNGRHFDTVVLIKFAIPVSLFFIAFALLMHIDILFAKAILVDDTKIGFYTSAQALSRIIYFVFAAFSTVLLPSISSAIANSDLELIKKYIKQSLRYMLMLLIPTCFIMSATSDRILTLFYSSTYAEAASPLSILVFGVSFLSMSLVLSTIMQGYGTPNVPLVIFSILVPLHACLLLVMIPRLELLGAALATSLTCFTGFVISCSFIYKEFTTLLSIRSLLKIISASIITYFIALQFSFSGFLLPCYYFGLFALYFFILLTLKEISDDDISFARGMFSRVRKNKKQLEVLGQET